MPPEHTWPRCAVRDRRTWLREFTQNELVVASEDTMSQATSDGQLSILAQAYTFKILFGLDWRR